MKKILKIVLWALAVLVLCVASALLFFQVRGIPKYEVEKISIQVDYSEAHIEKGKRIATMLCIQCHANNAGQLTGKHITDVPKEFGTIFSRNITHDKVNGIGLWSDGDLYYFLRTGVKPDGQYVPPYMPKFPLMADEDVKDVIAWLRSDSKGLESTSEEAPESEPSLLVKVLSNVAFKPMPLPMAPILKPDTADIIEFGKYYANAVSSCFQCHSKNFKTNNALIPEESEGFYGGGNPLLDFDGNIVPSANLTFHETGISAYTEAEFVIAVKFGKKRNGSYVKYPMVPHNTMTDQEVKAMYAYLKTVPKIETK
jgi:mono/diheme cytochrome c family protein